MSNGNRQRGPTQPKQDELAVSNLLHPVLDDGLMKWYRQNLNGRAYARLEREEQEKRKQNKNLLLSNNGNDVDHEHRDIKVYIDFSCTNGGSDCEIYCIAVPQNVTIGELKHHILQDEFFSSRYTPSCPVGALAHDRMHLAIPSSASFDGEDNNTNEMVPDDSFLEADHGYSSENYACICLRVDILLNIEIHYEVRTISAPQQGTVYHLKKIIMEELIGMGSTAASILSLEQIRVWRRNGQELLHLHDGLWDCGIRHTDHLDANAWDWVAHLRTLRGAPFFSMGVDITTETCGSFKERFRNQRRKAQQCERCAPLFENAAFQRLFSDEILITSKGSTIYLDDNCDNDRPLHECISDNHSTLYVAPNLSNARPGLHQRCTIAKPKHRGINLVQLRQIAVNILSRCSPEQWRSTSPQLKGKLLRPEEVTLYDLMEHYIRPVTTSQRCSYVELIAANKEDQIPQVFCSHWWGEPVLGFIACLERHAFDRQISEDTPYWICAYALNQHDLSGEMLAMSPRQSPFYEAMHLAKGTVSVIDANATGFSRIWCVFEIFIVLSELKKATTVSTDHKEDCMTDEKPDGFSCGDSLSDVAVYGQGRLAVVGMTENGNEEPDYFFSGDDREGRGELGDITDVEKPQSSSDKNGVSCGDSLSDGAVQGQGRLAVVGMIENGNEEPDHFFSGDDREGRGELGDITDVEKPQSSSDENRCQRRAAADVPRSTRSDLDNNAHHQDRLLGVQSKNDYYYDMYAVARDGHGNPAAPVGLTDGIVTSDMYRLDKDGLRKQIARGDRHKARCKRQALFPLDICHKILAMKLEEAQATVGRDKAFILNSIVGKVDNLLEEPPATHMLYDTTNAALWAMLAEVVYRTALETGDTAMADFRRALYNAPYEELIMSFDGCREFRAEANLFVQSLPLLLSRLTLDMSEIDYVNADEFSAGLGHLKKLKYLELILRHCKGLQSTVSLWSEVSQLKGLEELHANFMGCSNLTSVNGMSKVVYNLPALSTLDLDFGLCNITSLDTEKQQEASPLPGSNHKLSNFRVSLYRNRNLQHLEEIGHMMASTRNLHTVELNCRECPRISSIETVVQALDLHRDLASLELTFSGCGALVSVHGLGSTITQMPSLQKLCLRLGHCDKLADAVENLVGYVESSSFPLLEHLHLNFSWNSKLLFPNTTRFISSTSMRRLKYLWLEFENCKRLESLSGLAKEFRAMNYSGHRLDFLYLDFSDTGIPKLDVSVLETAICQGNMIAKEDMTVLPAPKKSNPPRRNISRIRNFGMRMRQPMFVAEASVVERRSVVKRDN